MKRFGSVPIPLCNIFLHVLERMPDRFCTRQVRFAITRNLNVDLAGDQHLRTSCISLGLQGLNCTKSMSMYDRLKIVFEACTYLLRFGGCRRLLIDACALYSTNLACFS